MDAPHAGRIGQRVGAYVLERLIGRGGMSVVFFARHEATGRSAAVKILQTGLPENIVAARRLEQEARTIARIDHPHVVRIYDSGRTADGLPWFAMEHLEGEPLSRVFARHGRLPVDRMLDIVRQMLGGLAKAHALDIVHRDLKPDNVFLVRRDDGADFVKMLDFGIAKLVGPQPNAVESVAGVVLGTPEYLSPEVAMDVDVSPASDIYALGVVMFEGLCGRLPFTGRSPTVIAEHHCFTPPPRPREFVPDLPVALEQIVLRCLAKDPAERYRDAEALDAALRRLRQSTSPIPTLERPHTDELPRIHHDDPLDAAEDAVRRALDRRPALRAVTTQPLALLERLRQTHEALEAEREDVQRQLEAQDGDLSVQEHNLVEAMAESDALDEDIRRLREMLRSEFAPPEGDDDAAALLDDFDPAARRLDPSFDARLARLGQRAVELEQVEERRTALVGRIEDAVKRQARLDARCARLEADLILSRAAETGRVARLRCRLEGVQVEMEITRQRRARLLGELLQKTRGA